MRVHFRTRNVDDCVETVLVFINYYYYHIAILSGAIINQKTYRVLTRIAQCGRRFLG